jgi:guanine nucleotide-binding protein G(i) subunit alpha
VAITKDKAITKELDADKKRITGEMRLLLLGAGESGKSTITKQLKILYYNGFNLDEREEYVNVIHSNIHHSVQNVVAASKSLSIPFSREVTGQIGESFLEPFLHKITPELSLKIEQFWKDESIPKILQRRHEFQLLDNTQYFIENLKRVTEKGYLPTDEDIIRSRAATTGIIQTIFSLQSQKLILVDVGGQRSERKKWIHCFDNVTAVLFCVAISAFDLTLYEDNITNRMHEALKLFHEICTSKWFTTSSIVLFLNKSDIFRTKLADGKSISITFPEFKHGSDYDASVEYINRKFTNVIDPVSKQKRDIFSHVTTATDASNVAVVFEAVKTYVMNEALKRSFG